MAHNDIDTRQHGVLRERINRLLFGSLFELGRFNGEGHSDGLAHIGKWNLVRLTRKCYKEVGVSHLIFRKVLLTRHLERKQLKIGDDLGDRTLVERRLLPVRHDGLGHLLRRLCRSGTLGGRGARGSAAAAASQEHRGSERCRREYAAQFHSSSFPLVRPHSLRATLLHMNTPGARERCQAKRRQADCKGEPAVERDGGTCNETSPAPHRHRARTFSGAGDGNRRSLRSLNPLRRFAPCVLRWQMLAHLLSSVPGTGFDSRHVQRNEPGTASAPGSHIFWSGRRESNPRHQLGRLGFYH